MDAGSRQLAISRVFGAPRALVYRAFTDPDQLAAWCRPHRRRHGELHEGVMHVTGQLQEGIEPFETKFRFEFHDEVDGRTRLEIRQWLPEHLTGPSEDGWLEAFAKLDAMLNGARAGSAPVVEV